MELLISRFSTIRGWVEEIVRACVLSWIFVLCNLILNEALYRTSSFGSCLMRENPIEAYFWGGGLLNALVVSVATVSLALTWAKNTFQFVRQYFSELSTVCCIVFEMGGFFLVGMFYFPNLKEIALGKNSGKFIWSSTSDMGCYEKAMLLVDVKETGMDFSI